MNIYYSQVCQQTTGYVVNALEEDNLIAFSDKKSAFHSFSFTIYEW